MNAFSVKNIWAIWLVAVLLTGCKGSFTDDEMKIVREGEGVMCLWTVENLRKRLFATKGKTVAGYRWNVGNLSDAQEENAGHGDGYG